ncbi:MAG: hypothetical protein AAGH15_10430 [Myxococcota bacterium]
MRNETTLFLIGLLALGGCTFGLDDTTRFATRDATLRATLEAGAFRSMEGTVEVVPQSPDLAEGVVVLARATSEDGQTVRSTLEIHGDLQSLCPGASVELRGAGTLRAVAVRGPGGPALEDLEATLVLDVPTMDGSERVAPERLVLSVERSTDGFNRLSYAASDMGGEAWEVDGAFDIAVFVEEMPAPGWRGATWEGQPIEAWD